MGARLLFRDAQGRSGEVALTEDTPVYVGRALDCAVRTDDAMVSRKHSFVKMDAGRYFVEDLGSSNGTHVNDVKVSRQVLNHNDVVRCGNLWLRYIEDAPADTGPPEPTGPGAATAAPTGQGAGRWKQTVGASLPPPSGTDDTFDASAAAAEAIATVESPNTAPGTGPSIKPESPPVTLAAAAARGGVMPPTTAPPTSDLVPPAAARGIIGAGPPPAASVHINDPTPPAPTPQPEPREPLDGSTTPVPTFAPGTSDAHTGTVPLPATDPGSAAIPGEAQELRRRLRTATSRAAELERSLRTLQAELDAVQGKVKAVIEGVRELKEMDEN